MLRLLINILEIINFDKEDIEKSIEKPDFVDMEDLFQYNMALKAGMDYVITRDRKD